MCSWHSLSSVVHIGSFYMGLILLGTVPKWVRLGLAFTRDPLELFQIELLAVPKWIHLRRRSHLEPYPERSHANGWNGSKRKRLGSDAATVPRGPL